MNILYERSAYPHKSYHWEPRGGPTIYTGYKFVRRSEQIYKKTPMRNMNKAYRVKASKIVPEQDGMFKIYFDSCSIVSIELNTGL
jgi:hypothetical protein